MKIAVIGYSGSGKSTLAKRLADYLGIPVLYLDTVQFEALWKERDRKEALALVTDFMKNDSWVIDGNYSNFCQQERLAQADEIIFLKFHRINCLWRACKRFFKYKNTSRESMAQGCNEKIDLEFIWWILYKGRTRKIRGNYQRILTQYRSKVTIIKNQKQLTAFMIARTGH